LRPAVAPVIPSDASASAALGPLFEARRAANRTTRPAAGEIAARLDREQRRTAQAEPPPGPQPLQGPQTGVQLTGRTTAAPPPPATPPAAPPGPAPGNLAGEVLRLRRQREE
jgi:hypothetical protein